MKDGVERFVLATVGDAPGLGVSFHSSCTLWPYSERPDLLLGDRGLPKRGGRVKDDWSRGDVPPWLQGIGNTPVGAVTLVIEGRSHQVFLKLEGYNPGGSVKDRTAASLIYHLEQRGVLWPGATLVESTSGNLGVALAQLARTRGYGFIAVIDPKTTAENIAKMRALDAAIDLVDTPDPAGGFLLSRLERVTALCATSRDLVWTDQYSNQANPLAHYLSTGPEIYRQMQRSVGAVFIPVSTGGTLSGIARFLRAASPETAIVGVDARGSVVFGSISGPRRLTGIGSSRKSEFLAPHLYDQHYLITDEAAFAFCRALFAATGLKVGGSSGAALAACARHLRDHPDLEHTVCLCADRGENYETTIFSDDWLAAQDIAITPRALAPVQEIRPAGGWPSGELPIAGAGDPPLDAP